MSALVSALVASVEKLRHKSTGCFCLGVSSHTSACQSIASAMAAVKSDIPEDEETRRGAAIARVFKLRKDRVDSARFRQAVWQTEVGSKTNLGLFRMMRRAIEEGDL